MPSSPDAVADEGERGEKGGKREGGKSNLMKVQMGEKTLGF